MEENNIKTKVVGVDISIESTTYAMVDVRGNILAEDAFPTEDYPDVNNFVTALSEKIVTMVEQNGKKACESSSPFIDLFSLALQFLRHGKVSVV